MYKLLKIKFILARSNFSILNAVGRIQSDPYIGLDLGLIRSKSRILRYNRFLENRPL